MKFIYKIVNELEIITHEVNEQDYQEEYINKYETSREDVKISRDDGKPNKRLNIVHYAME